MFCQNWVKYPVVLTISKKVYSYKNEIDILNGSVCIFKFYSLYKKKLLSFWCVGKVT